jgi:hypothetical protein
MSGQENKEQVKHDVYLDLWQKEVGRNTYAQSKIRKLERLLQRSKDALLSSSVRFGCGCLTPNVCKECREAESLCDLLLSELR